MGSTLDIAAVVALLQAGETVLVPTSRAAQALRFQYDTAQRHRGLAAWEPAPVFCWTEWTESLWSTLTLEGTESRVLLNRLQEEALWAEIIGTFPQSSAMEPNAIWQMATLARSALQLVAAHNAVAKVRANTAESPDAQAFAAFRRTFAQRCEREDLMSRALLEEAVALHARQGTLALPRTIHLLGFEERTPAQQHLLSFIAASKCQQHAHTLHSSNRRTSPPKSLVATDPGEELKAAVHWIREHVQNSPDRSGPIALILPNPAKERAELEPLFRETLAPELEAVQTDLSSTPWHFSAGPNLGSLPIIRDALLALRWTDKPLSIEDIRNLLFSPFFTHSQTLDERARFEMHTLRRSLIVRPELSLEDVLAAVPNSNSSDALLPWSSVRRLASDLKKRTQTAPHAFWTDQIRKLLRAAGWPGPRTLSASEYRTTEAWESLLDLLATLDIHGGRLTLPAVLDLLEREAQAMTVPDAMSMAPVQVITLAESEACVFESVLLMRATDEHLPPTEHLHPLLDWRLQQALKFPGTDPAAAYERAREALVNLSDRCGTMLLTAAQEDQRGPLRFTPLAAELVVATEPARDENGSARMEYARVAPQTIHDSDPLPPLPPGQTPGGARVLELQAACGFLAFASQRLGAKVPETKTLGLDPRQTGSVLHEAMARLWAEVKTQKALNALAAPGRLALVQRCVSDALNHVLKPKAPEARWTEAYVGVVRRTLADLLNRWLEFERTRAPFEVLSQEEEQTVEVGPLQLRIRPDRVDQVDGGFVYIDYKTSSGLSTKDWLGERPDAPQLPLYVLLRNPEEIRGLGFGRLRRGKQMGWVSLEDTPGIFPARSRRSQHNLAEQIPQWRAELDRLATEFALGNTDVHPKQYPKTCQYCDHRLLCRLDPVTMLADAEDDTDRDGADSDG